MKPIFGNHVRVLILLLAFSLSIFSLSSLFKIQGKNLIRSDDYSRNSGTFDKLRSEASALTGWFDKDQLALSLEPGAFGSAIYEFHKPKNSKAVFLESYFYNQGVNEILISLDNKNWTSILKNSNLFEVPINLSDYLKDNNIFYLKFDANNQSKELQKINEGIIINYYKNFWQIPPFSHFLPLLSFPFLIYLLFSKKQKNYIFLLLLFSILALGFRNSLSALNTYLYHTIDPDSVCLIQAKFNIGSLKNGPFGTFCQSKESATTIIYLIFFKIFGFGSEIGVRFSGIIFHILTIFLVFVFGQKIKGIICALVASYFVATHQYLVLISVRGNRDTIFSFAILLFIFMLFEKTSKPFILFIFSAVLAIYTRLSSLTFLILITIFSKQFKNLTPVFLVALPIILTNLYYYHTWNYSETRLIRASANVEFAGSPNFASKYQTAKDTFKGDSISAFTYFFRLHTLDDFIKSNIEGAEITFKQLYFPNNNFGLYLFLIGSFLCLLKRKYWYLPVLAIFLETPLFFLVTKKAIEFRSLTYALPLIGLIVGYSVASFFNILFLRIHFPNIAFISSLVNYIRNCKCSRHH